MLAIKLEIDNAHKFLDFKHFILRLVKNDTMI